METQKKIRQRFFDIQPRASPTLHTLCSRYWSRCRSPRVYKWFHGGLLISLSAFHQLTYVHKKNAQAPLSLVFNHQSALENMHCQLLLRVMRYHGLGVLLDDPNDGPCLRRILLFSVLATDMGVHQDFMLRFKRMLDGESTSLCARQTLICEAILKNADISNPVSIFQS